MKTRKKLLLVAPESEYGAGADLAAAILLVVSELESSPYEGDRVERARIRQTFGAEVEANAAPYTTVTATIPLAGSGTAGTPPNFGLLLRACGMSETIVSDVGSESVTYQPATDEHESACVWFVEDGQLQKVPGARGTIEFSLTAKEYPTMQYTMTGFYQRPEAHTDPVTQTVTDIADELVVNKQNTATFSVHGHEGCGQSMSFSLGNEVVHRALIGCEGVYITDRSVSGQVEIEAPDITTKNYFEAMESHEGVTLGVIELEHGKTAGNIVNIRGPKVQLATLSRNDADGLVHYQMDARYTPDAGDDEIAITFK
ncbi:hypothetical protein SAMN04487958_107203 [Vreelandella subterranea]|uniref:Uncharacterized protein n=1 Tax=Vreelandella subterranea TaxID=416874 RepID=A0A1H9UTA4_9GAMM|nr:phage tail tube protein [Halomonas subterranea]SES12569.1 hypothetical protein SAMN04487958_107203 [Halomonas subterranea]